MRVAPDAMCFINGKGPLSEIGVRRQAAREWASVGASTDFRGVDLSFLTGKKPSSSSKTNAPLKRRPKAKALSPIETGDR
jgi:hypothetical protein